GYNRVYAYTGGDRSYEAWWKAIKAGRTFVTNGPLLRVKANSELPGHIFHIHSGQPLPIRISGQLSGNDRPLAIELVHNGKVSRHPLYTGLPGAGVVIDFRVDSPGWFLVRVIADNDRTFRFASTAPFYVESEGSSLRISKSAVRFFLDWLDERKARLKIPD